MFHTDIDGNIGSLTTPITVEAPPGVNVNYNISQQLRRRGKNYLIKLIKI